MVLDSSGWFAIDLTCCKSVSFRIILDSSNRIIQVCWISVSFWIVPNSSGPAAEAWILRTKPRNWETKPSTSEPTSSDLRVPQISSIFRFSDPRPSDLWFFDFFDFCWFFSSQILRSQTLKAAPAPQMQISADFSVLRFSILKPSVLHLHRKCRPQSWSPGSRSWSPGSKSWSPRSRSWEVKPSTSQRRLVYQRWSLGLQRWRQYLRAEALRC